MASLLGTMDSLPEPTVKSRKRKPSPQYEYDNSSSPVRPSYRDKPSYGDTSSDGPLSDHFDALSGDDVVPSPKKRVRTEAAGIMTPAADRLAQLEVDDFDMPDDSSFDDIDMDSFMTDDIDDIKPMIVDKKPPPTKKEEPDALPSWLSVYDSLTVNNTDALGPLSSTTPSAKSNNISALEPDGSLRFFWLDYLEHEGRLYFIGKLKDKTSGAWVSCCVTVENLQRNLFVLPREKRVEYDQHGTAHDTDEVPDLSDVYDDFDRIRKKAGIKSYKGKFVKRKYAFGEPDVPREESQWMKVVYGFDGTSTHAIVPGPSRMLTPFIS